jgi:hypothetical protein
MVTDFSMPLWIRAFCLTILVVVSISVSRMVLRVPTQREKRVKLP